MRHALFLRLMLLVLIDTVSLTAADDTWTGAAGDGLWSDGGNWSTGSAPTAGDAAIFDGTASGNVTIDVASAVGSVQVNAGYTGTITMAANLTVAGDMSLQSGSWSAHAQTLTVGGSLVIGSTAGLFDAGASTVALTGTGTLSSPVSPFATLQVGASGQTTTITADVIVTTGCSVGAGTLAFQNWAALHLRGTGNMLSVGGSINSVAPNRGIIAYEATGSSPIYFGGDYGWCQIQLIAWGGADADFEQSASVTNIDSLETGATDAASQCVWNTNSFGVYSSSWLSIGSWGSSPAGTTINCGNSIFNVPGLSWITTGNDQANLQTSTWQVGEWAVWDSSAIVDPGTSTVTVNGGIGPMWTPVTSSFYNLKISGACPMYGPVVANGSLEIQSGGTLTTQDQPLTVAGTCTVDAGGSLVADAAAIAIGGTVTIANQDGAFVAGSSTVTITGANAAISDPDQNNPFACLTIAAPGSVFLLTDVTTMTCTAINAGATLDLHNYAAGTAAVLHLQGSGDVLTLQGNLWGAASAGSLGGVQYEATAAYGSSVIHIAGGSYGWSSLRLCALGGTAGQFAQQGDITNTDDIYTYADSSTGSVSWSTDGYGVQTSSWMTLGDWSGSQGGTTMHCSNSFIQVPVITWFTTPYDVLDMGSSYWKCASWGFWDPTGVMQPGSSTVEINGGSIGVPWTSIPQLFCNLIINSDQDDPTYGPLTVQGNLIVEHGTLDLENDSAVVAGDIVVSNGGSIAAGGQTIELGGSSSQRCALTTTSSVGGLEIDGGNRVISVGACHIGTLTVAAGPTLRVDASALVSVDAAISLSGTSVAPIFFTSSASGTPWLLNVSSAASQSLSYVQAQDSNASLGAAIQDGTSGTDLGGNENWIFPSNNGGGSGSNASPDTPVVTISITGGLSGDQSDTSGSVPHYFSNNSSVTVSVSATEDVGTIQSVSLISSDGQSIDCTSGSCTYTPPEDGEYQLFATAIATNSGDSAVGTSTPIALIRSQSFPSLRISYLPPNTSVSARISMRTSLTSDADLVVLNGASDDGINASLRAQRAMNVFAKLNFVAAVEVDGLVGISTGTNLPTPSASISGAQSGVLTQVQVVHQSNGPDVLTLGGLPAMDDSIIYDGQTLQATTYNGRYTLHLKATDRCGNTFDQDLFKLWVKTKAPSATLATMPRLFQDHPTFQIAQDGMTAMIPARFIASTPDAMDCYQNASDDVDAMLKLVMTPDGVPSSQPQANPVLSVWALNTPIVPTGTSTTDMNPGLTVDPSWPVGKSTILVRDTAGNLSDPIPVTATLTELSGQLPPDPPNFNSIDPITYAPITILTEQAFDNDKTIWSLGYPTIWALWPDGPVLCNEASCHPLTGVLPTITINGVTQQSSPPQLAYLSAVTSEMNMDQVQYVGPLFAPDGAFGPRVITVPPSWATNAPQLTMMVHRPGLASPLVNPTPRQHYLVVTPNNNQTITGGDAFDSYTITTTDPYATVDTWTYGTPLTGNQSLIPAGYEADPSQQNIIDQGQNIFGALGVAPPTWDVTGLDTRLTETQAVPWASNSGDDATRQFTFTVSREGITPGFERFTYHRDGAITTPLNPQDVIVPPAYTNTNTTINYPSPFNPEKITTVVTSSADGIALIQRDYAQTSSYQQQTGFRWANLVKIDNDIITTGSTTVSFEGGFLSKDFQISSATTSGASIHIIDPDVYASNDTEYGVGTTADYETQINSLQAQFAQTTDPTQQKSYAQEAVNDANSAVDAAQAVVNLQQNISNDLTAAQSALSTAQSELQAASNEAAIAQAQSDIAAAQYRIDHDTIILNAINGPVSQGETALEYYQDAQTQLSSASSALASNGYAQAISNSALSATAATEALRAVVSATAEVSVTPQFGQTYGSSVIAINSQQFVCGGNNASLCQTLQIGMNVGSDVPAKIYDVDIRMGAVREYTDQLSLAAAGENGSHRMDKALAIYGVSFIDRSGTPQPFLRVAGNSMQEESADFIADTETGDKAVYVRLAIPTEFNVGSIDMNLAAGDATVASHLSETTLGVLISDTPVILLPPLADTSIVGSSFTGLTVAAQRDVDPVKAAEGLMGFRVTGTTSLPSQHLQITASIPVQVVTEISWIQGLPMPEDNTFFKVSASPGFTSIPLVVVVNSTTKSFFAVPADGDTVGNQNDTEEWYDATFTCNNFAAANEQVALTIDDDIPNQALRPSDNFTVSDHASYLVDTLGEPLLRVFGNDQDGRSGGGIDYAGVQSPVFVSVQYLYPPNTVNINSLYVTLLDGSVIPLTETTVNSQVFISNDGQYVIVGNDSSLNPEAIDTTIFTWAQHAGDSWIAGAATCQETSLASLLFTPVGAGAASSATVSSVALPASFDDSIENSIAVTTSDGSVQSWQEIGPGTHLFASPDGSGVLGVGPITGGVIDSVLLQSQAAGLISLSPQSVGSTVYVPILARAPGEQISDVPIQPGFSVVKRGNFPGSGVTIQTPLETKSFADGVLIIPTYGPSQNSDEIQILPGDTISVIASDGPVGEGSAPAGGSDKLYDGNGNPIDAQSYYIGTLVGNSDGETYRIFEFPDGPVVKDKDGNSGNERVLYAYTDGNGVFTTSGTDVFLDQGHTQLAGQLFYTAKGDPHLYRLGSDPRFKDRDAKLERGYDRISQQCNAIAEALQGANKTKAVVDATLLLFGPSDGDITPVITAWENGENVGQVIVCGGKQLTKSIVMNAIGGFLVKWGGKVAVNVAAKTLGATKVGAATAAAVTSVFATMRHCTGKWGAVVNGFSQKLRGHFGKHVSGLYEGQVRPKEWEIFGGIQGVVIADEAAYAKRALDLINAADKSFGNYRVYKQVLSGKTKKIVYNAGTNELAIWNATDDTILTLFRPYVDKNPSDVKTMFLGAAAYIAGKIKNEGWVEVK